MRITLAYNGKIYDLPGLNHKVTWSGGIKSEDQSGKTSNSSDSHDGYKAVLVTVTLSIQEKDSKALEELYAIFYRTKDKIPVIYNIIHSDLNMFGINQVRFHEDIRIASAGQTKAYDITLTLKQYLPDKELDDKRNTKTTTAETKQPEGTNSVSLNESIDTASSDEGTSGMFEKILKFSNDFAKDHFFKDES